jgi:DnaK suppressor protein
MSSKKVDQLQAIHEMLLRERAAVLRRMGAIAQDALDLDVEDDGVPTSTYGQDGALTKTLEARLANIEEALERLEQGTYGICAECGNEIPPRRLQALPFAKLCVRCQSEADKSARLKPNRS